MSPEIPRLISSFSRMALYVRRASQPRTQAVATNAALELLLFFKLANWQRPAEESGGNVAG